ncbi:MAG: formate dehydrogenase accessory sulfurtransferase FdhD [Alistipes senegalensis]|nr:formate dehydrogenase accessory sulfurtransferase FdhD [Oxalobacter formigenes]MCM1281764.1 formate dehydrogenase accessory sulfurtransferase FdhD [Alistipes senegalensis]
MAREKTVRVAACCYRHGQFSEVADVLAAEVPVFLEYNGIPYTVLLATPDDLADLAVGFSLTEGIVATAADLSVGMIAPQPEGWRIALQIAGAQVVDRLAEKRCVSFALPCGKRDEGGQAACGALPAPVYGEEGLFTPDQLHAGFAQMEAQQVVRTQTGATHAAAWMDATGQVTLIREDVARHNALDKLIGALAQKKEGFSSGAVLVTSRASHEMVRKCVAVGVRVLAAISAPTALAVRVAQDAGMTLAAFVRQTGFTVYTCPARLCGKREGTDVREETR